jgi:hypothetical protein
MPPKATQMQDKVGGLVEVAARAYRFDTSKRTADTFVVDEVVDGFVQVQVQVNVNVTRALLQPQLRRARQPPALRSRRDHRALRPTRATADSSRAPTASCDLR